MLEKLVAFPTVSSNSNLDLIAFVEDYLAAYGVASQRVPSDCGEKANLYATTSANMHVGHSNEDVPFGFSKGPEPSFENMQHALKHKSCYLGFMAL